MFSQYEAPFGHAFVISPANGVEFSTATKAIYVGGTGIVTARIDDKDISFIGVPAGTILPVVATRVNSADADQVQTIAAVEDATDGTYALTFNLYSGETFTTAALAHDASAATIETAVDTAATAASVAGWTNGDISVSGGPLDTNDVVLTFDGDSVDALPHDVTTVDSELLGDPAAVGMGDVVELAAGVAAVDQVQEIAAFVGAASGTFVLRFVLATGEGFFTAPIAYNATAATIETAIDVAADDAVDDWTNGAISVSGGAINANPVVVTFDGAYVAALQHDLIEGYSSVLNSATLPVAMGAIVIDTQAVAETSQVQRLDVFDGEADDGTYTLEFVLESTEDFTTAALAHDATAATVEAAINSAATTATITNWTNGDIEVSGGPLTVAPLVFEFTGDSVAGLEHELIDATSVDVVTEAPDLEAADATVTTQGYAASTATGLIGLY